jgi:hypothetical protein
MAAAVCENHGRDARDTGFSTLIPNLPAIGILIPLTQDPSTAVSTHALRGKTAFGAAVRGVPGSVGIVQDANLIGDFIVPMRGAMMLAKHVGRKSNTPSTGWKPA